MRLNPRHLHQQCRTKSALGKRTNSLGLISNNQQQHHAFPTILHCCVYRSRMQGTFPVPAQSLKFYHLNGPMTIRCFGNSEGNRPLGRQTTDLASERQSDPLNPNNARCKQSQRDRFMIKGQENRVDQCLIAGNELMLICARIARCQCQG